MSAVHEVRGIECLPFFLVSDRLPWSFSEDDIVSGVPLADILARLAPGEGVYLVDLTGAPGRPRLTELVPPSLVPPSPAAAGPRADETTDRDGSTAPFTVRPRTAADDDVAHVLVTAWGGPDMVVGGRVLRLLDLPALLALDGDEVVGVLTYELRHDELEIVSCDSLRRRAGVGRALVTAVADVAHSAGIETVVCTTTNDNVGALAFWQRMGLRVVAVRPGAVDAARRRKPSIPVAGEHGIEIHDEIDLRGSAGVLRA